MWWETPLGKCSHAKQWVNISFLTAFLLSSPSACRTSGASKNRDSCYQNGPDWLLFLSVTWCRFLEVPKFFWRSVWGIVWQFFEEFFDGFFGWIFWLIFFDKYLPLDFFWQFFLTIFFDKFLTKFVFSQDFIRKTLVAKKASSAGFLLAQVSYFCSSWKKVVKRLLSTTKDLVDLCQLSFDFLSTSCCVRILKSY